MMTLRMTTIERAFELASSGNYVSVSEIRKQLDSEGFYTSQITGGVLLRQLRNLMQQAQKHSLAAREDRASA
jgi:hypothetical protein